MKHPLLLILFVLLLVSGPIACKTTPQTPQSIAPRLELLSTLATQEILIDNPGWREDFQLVSQNLAILTAKESITVADIIAVIRTLKIKELQSREARLAFAGAQIVFMEGTQTIELKNNADLRLYAQAIQRGIDAGLK